MWGAATASTGLNRDVRGVPGSELPLNDRKNKTANNMQFAYAA